MGVILIAGTVHTLYNGLGTSMAEFPQHRYGCRWLWSTFDRRCRQIRCHRKRGVVSQDQKGNAAFMSYSEILFSNTDRPQVCRHFQFPTVLGSWRYQIIRSVPLQKNLPWQIFRRHVLGFDRTCYRLDHSVFLSSLVSMRCTRRASVEH